MRKLWPGLRDASIARDPQETTVRMLTNLDSWGQQAGYKGARTYSRHLRSVYEDVQEPSRAR
jgi:hypothetical protein